MTKTRDKYFDEMKRLQTEKNNENKRANEMMMQQVKVPLHGEFKSFGVQLEEHMVTKEYSNVFKHCQGEKTGISGKILNFGLSSQQKASLLTENYLRFQD